MRLPAGLRRNRTGIAAIEFAIILPILMILAAGAFELGQAAQSLSSVNKLASRYATAWADCNDSPAGTCNTEMGLYDSSQSIRNLAPQLSGTVTLQMFQIVMNGSTPTIVYSYPANASLSSAQITAAQNVITSGQKGVVISVFYNYNVRTLAAFLSGVVPATIPMNFTIAQIKA